MLETLQKVAFLAVLSLGASDGPVQAEIVKTATLNCEGRICFHWWPKVSPLTGWHTDHTINENLNINVLIPDGSTWQSADTIMYAQAAYKPRYPELTSLSAFIDDDRKSFAQNNSRISIDEISPIATKYGQRLRSFTYFRPDDRNWERVSYGEEGDYYLLFVLNAHTELGYRKAQAMYARLIQEYRR